ncbi:MAG: hypothetical protein J5986_11315 [Roseburia sp.]|nr:hypothetical protein [Roseburia sp.]
METILSYLDNMFLSLPKTPETERAKAELAAMMEDKYNELLAEGKRENEAVGIVISEFGNLEELKEELGLEGIHQTETAGTQSTKRYIRREEAEEYLSFAGKAYKWIALGVLLCIWCPIPLFVFGNVEGISDVSMVFLGLIPLFVMIAVAVGLFIYHGIKLEKYEFMKKEQLKLDEGFLRELREQKESGTGRFAASIIIGVSLCIFGVVQFLVFGALESDDDYVLGMSAAILLFLVGIAVVCFIIAGARRECLNILLEEGDYSEGKKNNAKLIDRIGSVYWTAAVVIYLAWSFVTMNWGFTWIVWPIAGVLFGLVAAVCNLIKGENKA